MDQNAKVLNARFHTGELTPLIFVMNRISGKRGKEVEEIAHTVNRELYGTTMLQMWRMRMQS